MRQLLSFLSLLIFAAVLQGCSAWKMSALTQGTDDKNIGMDGYLLYGKLDTADSASGAPVGKMIVGRLVYKSRKVGIPADQKVPFTGNFKSTTTKSLFGTEEHIVEYDFTAGSSSEAAAAETKLEQLKDKVTVQKEQ